eukprot:9494557-Pyramimonas_sp.AAC.1
MAHGAPIVRGSVRCGRCDAIRLPSMCCFKDIFSQDSRCGMTGRTTAPRVHGSMAHLSPRLAPSILRAHLQRSTPMDPL